MPTSSLTAQTRATPAQAFSVLSDLGGYRLWLPHSSSYRGTRTMAGAVNAAGDGAEGSLRVGDRYADRTPLGHVNGVVTDIRPGRGISFHQATSDGALSIDIDYALTPTLDGTVIHRTGTIRTSGRLGPIGALVAWLTRRENARTMRHLVTHLDSLSTPEEGRHG